MTLAKCAHFFGGAWRIRTAVDGFADRRLRHSSKAPFRFASAKVGIFDLLPKVLLSFFDKKPSSTLKWSFMFVDLRIISYFCVKE